MKLNINKACDLSSISVLPPSQQRRSSIVSTGHQMSQLRSQPSEQSFSQGLSSSQHGMFSQLSQNSLDEMATNDQRFGSQERENSIRRISCLPPVNQAREENQMQISRSSTNITRKWNASSATDHRCQISEELERRIGMMETSVMRFGMILDSVQSDIMQVNKGTKEVLLETEGIRQKLSAHDDLLQQMGQDIKANLDEGLSSVSDQLSKDKYQDNFKEALSVLSAFPEKIEASLLKLRSDLSMSLAKEMEKVACILKIPIPRKGCTPLAVLPKKDTGHFASPQINPQSTDKTLPPKICMQPRQHKKIVMGCWNSVKVEEAASTVRDSSKKRDKKGVTYAKQGRECRIDIASDEDMDEGFSCLADENETGKETDDYIMAAREETDRILRRARRRKRKHHNRIIID